MVNLLLYKVISLTFQLFPILYLFILIFGILVIYWLFIITLWEIQFNFQQAFKNAPTKRFDNPEIGQFIHLSLHYKIYSVPLTLFKTIFYFSLVILTVLSLRISRLDNTLDIIQLYYKFTYSHFTTKLIFIFLGLLYIYFIKTYFLTFSERLSFELKKLYIYLLQFGGMYDINNYKTGDDKYAYIQRWFEKPITSIYHLTTIFGHLSKPDLQRYQENLYVSIMHNVFIPIFWIPLYYFLHGSIYKNTQFNVNIKLFLIKLDNFIFKYFAIICYGLPIIILFWVIFYECYYKQSLLNNIYFIFVIIFCYKIYIDMVFFFEYYTDKQLNGTLCIYYYIIEHMHLKVNKEIARSILSKYTVLTDFEGEERFETYLENQLDRRKTNDILYTTEEERNLYDNVFQKIGKTITNSLILGITSYILSMISYYFYDKESFQSYLKNFKEIYNSLKKRVKQMNGGYEIWMSMIFISIVSLLCINYLFTFELKVTVILSLPLGVLLSLKLASLVTKSNPLIFYKTIIMCYSLLIIILYLCYTTQSNVLFMNEIFWNYKITVTQMFTVDEKIAFLKEYLNYLVYCKANYLTSIEKRELLSAIDFNYLSVLIEEDIKIEQLRELATNIIDLTYKKKSILIHLKDSCGK